MGDGNSSRGSLPCSLDEEILGATELGLPAVHTHKQDNCAATRCNRDLLEHTLNHKHKSLSSNLIHLYVESGLNELIIFRVCIVLKLWVNRSDDTVTIMPVLFMRSISVSLRRGWRINNARFDSCARLLGVALGSQELASIVPYLMQPFISESLMCRVSHVDVRGSSSSLVP